MMSCGELGLGEWETLTSDPSFSFSRLPSFISVHYLSHVLHGKTSVLYAAALRSSFSIPPFDDDRNRTDDVPLPVAEADEIPSDITA